MSPSAAPSTRAPSAATTRPSGSAAAPSARPGARSRSTARARCRPTAPPGRSPTPPCPSARSTAARPPPAADRARRARPGARRRAGPRRGRAARRRAGRRQVHAAAGRRPASAAAAHGHRALIVTGEESAARSGCAPTGSARCTTSSTSPPRPTCRPCSATSTRSSPAADPRLRADHRLPGDRRRARRRDPGPGGRRRADRAVAKERGMATCWSATSPRTARSPGPRRAGAPGRRRAALRGRPALPAAPGARRQEPLRRRPTRSAASRCTTRASPASPTPSGLFLTRRAEPVPGTCVTVTAGGPPPAGRRGAGADRADSAAAARPGARRPAWTPPGSRWCSPCWTARGAGQRSGERDVYAATVGGVKISEPAADLAIALALASAASDIAAARAPGGDRRGGPRGRGPPGHAACSAGWPRQPGWASRTPGPAGSGHGPG